MLYIRLKALQAETARTTANLRSEQAFEGEKLWANVLGGFSADSIGEVNF